MRARSYSHENSLAVISSLLVGSSPSPPAFNFISTLSSSFASGRSGRLHAGIDAACRSLLYFGIFSGDNMDMRGGLGALPLPLLALHANATSTDGRGFRFHGADVYLRHLLGPVGFGFGNELCHPVVWHTRAPLRPAVRAAIRIRRRLPHPSPLLHWRPYSKEGEQRARMG